MVTSQRKPRVIAGDVLQTHNGVTVDSSATCETARVGSAGFPCPPSYRRKRNFFSKNWLVRNCGVPFRSLYNIRFAQQLCPFPYPRNLPKGYRWEGRQGRPTVRREDTTVVSVQRRPAPDRPRPKGSLHRPDKTSEQSCDPPKPTTSHSN